jgi:Glycosyl transferase family 2
MSRTGAAPKISVVIPSYNTASLISCCLDSVFAQTYTDFEVLVINDGSPDTPELERVLESYMDRIIYIKQENKRAAGARNNGIRRARGEFIAFLDSDDTWFPTHLACQMRMFEQDRSLDLVYCDGLMKLNGGQQCRFTEKNPSRGNATFRALIQEHCQIPVSSVVARKRALVNAGFFDEQLPRCDDYDMWVRTAFTGAKIGYSSVVGGTIFAAERPGALSQSKARMIEAYWKILEKYLRTLPLSSADRVIVEERAAEIKARYFLEEGKCKTEALEFEEARKLISEANKHFRRSLLSIVVIGLSVAPRTTGRVMSFWRGARSETSV